MSGCIYGAFGQALGFRGLGSQKTKWIRTQNSRRFNQHFRSHEAEFRALRGYLQWDTPSYLSFPRIGIFRACAPDYVPWNRSCSSNLTKDRFLASWHQPQRLKSCWNCWFPHYRVATNISNMVASVRRCWLLIFNRVFWRLCKRIVRVWRASSGADVCGGCGLGSSHPLS
jgi:hypothetical protein